MADFGERPDGPDPGSGPPAIRPEQGAATPDRRLTDAEVSRVLRLASDADQASGLAREGVTVPQLAEAAREAGLDPRQVERAAAMVEDPVSTLATTAFGAPDTRTLRAFLPGRGIPRDHEALVGEMETALRRKGQLHERDPSRLVWKEDHTLGRTTLSMVETSDGTDVTLEADRAGHYLGSWFAGVVGWGLLAALTPLGSLGPVAAVAGFLVAPFVLARPFWVRADRRRRRRLESAMMAVLEQVDGNGRTGEEAALPPGDPDGS